MSNVKRTKIILVLLVTLIASIFMAVTMQIGTKVFASTTSKTVADVTFTMETGASIYNNEDDGKIGIRFGGYMTESDYSALRKNVGTEKAYKSIMFGVIIAPASYEDTNKFDKMNLFGIDDNGQATDGAKYDWAIWNGTSWEYNGNKIRVINIEQTRPQVKDGKVSVIGAITGIQESNLLTNFKGVGYIVAEKQDGTFDVKFATENDNVRNTVYVAQRTYQANLTKKLNLDPVNDALEISRLETENNTLATNYITDAVKAKEVSYSIEHYYKKPTGNGYFLFETTTGMGTINADLTAKNKDSTDVLGVTFDADNDNNGSDPVIYAQDKSVVKLYYDVVYGEDADNNEKVYDISATEDYAIDSGIIAVYSSDMALISKDGAVNNSSIVAMGKGERDLYVLTAKGFEKYSSIMATHVISTPDEFVSFFKSSLTNANSNSSVNWYVVVDSDIDVSSKTFSTMGSSWFMGTFNGLGHVVNGFTPADAYGMFGAVKTQAVIKNFALTNIPNTKWNIISYDFNGTLDNVYIQGALSADSTYRGVANVKSASAQINNCIVNISGFTRPAFQCSTTPIVNNSYAIGNKLTGFIGVYTTVQDAGVKYTTTTDFYSSEISNINLENGFNKYWSKSTRGLYFGNSLVAVNSNATVTETKEIECFVAPDYGTDDYTINLAELVGKTPEVVIINGEQVETANEITLDPEEYAIGVEYSIIIFTGDDIVEQPFMFATHVISTADEFVTFFNSFNTSAICNSTVNWYAVVDADIDLTTKTLSFASMGSSWYKGTFDGLGHVVNGFTPASAYGMFGTVSAGAVIKNLALTNVGPTAYNLFSYDFSGTLDNVYVQGKLSFDGTYRGVANVKSSSAQINNCIVNIAGLSLSAFQCSTVPSVSNSYAIGDKLTGFIGSNATVKDGGELYTTTSDFYSAEINDITLANGFNQYWSKTKVGLYFGSVLVAVNSNVTATETKETKCFVAPDYGTEEYTINLAEILGKKPEVVLVNGKELPVANEITLDPAEYTIGVEYSILIATGNTVIEQPFMFATHVISTADEFVTFFNSFNTSAICNSTVNWYAVVDADIDLTTKTLLFASMGSSWYKGTFDGLGHVVNGFTPASAHGMFGTVSAGAVIKNLALTNVGPTAYNLFSYDFSGKLDNVYVQGKLSFDGTYRGVANIKSSSAEINNCIVNISGLSLPAFQCSQNVQPIVSNSYAIGDSMLGFIGYQRTLKEGGELFSTYKEFSDARISSITSANSFNKYWNLTGDATNGYTLKFGNALVGTTVANAQ